MRISAQMSAEKDSSLAARTLEKNKNSHTHEKPMVSSQFGQVKMTILLFLFLNMAWLSDKYLFAPTMLEAVLILFVEILRTDARGWHLNRKVRTVKFMLKWPMVIIWHWLKSTDLYKVAETCNDICWTVFCVQTRKLFKVLPYYPRLFDSTLGFPGEGWGKGVDGSETGKSAKDGPRNLRT